MISKIHAEILQERDIDLELVTNLGWNTGKQDGGKWLIIPYIKNGRMVNRKYRAFEPQKEFRQDKDAVKCFWNYDCITDESLSDHPLVITEGEFDATIAIQAGFPRSVSVPDGAPAQSIIDPSSTKYNYVMDAIDDMRGVKRIVLATDGDGPGCVLRDDLAARIGKPRCQFIRYPEGCKDLNEVACRCGLERVRQIINEASWMKISGLFKMSDLPPMQESCQIKMGDDVLDYFIRVRRGDFHVLTGIPGMGKSTWINDMACRLALESGVVTAFFSPEQRTQIDHRRALRWRYTGSPPGTWTAMEEIAADNWIDDHFVFMVEPDDEDADLQWWFDTAMGAILRHNATVLIIDPWNELEHRRDSGQSLTEYVGDSIKQMKKFAKRMNVHLIVAAHPAKLQRDKKTGEIPIPTLYDISDSAHWINKADLGVVIHRDEVGCILNITKARYRGYNGVPGILRGVWDSRSNSIHFQPDKEINRAEI